MKMVYYVSLCFRKDFRVCGDAFVINEMVKKETPSQYELETRVLLKYNIKNISDVLNDNFHVQTEGINDIKHYSFGFVYDENSLLSDVFKAIGKINRACTQYYLEKAKNEINIIQENIEKVEHNILNIYSKENN